MEWCETRNEKLFPEENKNVEWVARKSCFCTSTLRMLFNVAHSFSEDIKVFSLAVIFSSRLQLKTKNACWQFEDLMLSDLFEQLMGFYCLSFDIFHFISWLPRMFVQFWKSIFSFICHDDFIKSHFHSSQTIVIIKLFSLKQTHPVKVNPFVVRIFPWGQTSLTLFSMTLHNFSNPTEMCFGGRKKKVLSNIKRRPGVRGRRKKIFVVS